MKFNNVVKESESTIKKEKEYANSKKKSWSNNKKHLSTGVTSEKTGFTGGTGDEETLSIQPKNWTPKK